MREKPQPKYIQLKKEIVSWLHSGKLKPGDQMPSENDITNQFQLSRQTVRQAFGELEQEGWLYRVQGKGTFASAPNVRQTKQVQTIGLVTTYISDYIFPHIVRGAEATLRSRGYRLVLSSTDNDKEKEKESLKLMMEQPLSGLIVEPTKSAHGNPNLSYFLSLEYHQIPFLMINERYPEMSCPYVKVDDEAGGYMLTEHLIQLGHRNIAGFFKTDDLQGVNRLKGFIRSHQAHHIPLKPELVIHYVTEQKETVPFEKALSILGNPEIQPSAIVCYNDELAVTLLEAVRQAGLSVPDDISIVGFDDSSLATATEVKLTTVKHPKMDMGVQAAEMLLEMIENQTKKQSEDIIYKPELVIRESTRKIQK